MPSKNATADRDQRRRQALCEASDWFAQWQAGELAESQRVAWQAWRDASDDNRWAWDRVETVSRRFAGVLEDDERQVAAEVIGRVRQQRRGRRRLLSGLAGLMVVAVLVGLTWQQTPVAQLAKQWSADYLTATGEVRQITLRDGTRIWLNTATALNVDDDDRGRLLELVAGEILVVTGGGTGQPLHIDTRSARLTPLGTRFSVRERTDDELLAVFDGAVEVRTRGLAGRAGETRVISAGQQTTFDVVAVAMPSDVQGARESWASGVLLAEGITLRALVDELGRYHRGRLQVDPAVADLTILGAFPVDDLSQTLHMIETTLPVQARHVMPWWIRVEPAER